MKIENQTSGSHTFRSRLRVSLQNLCNENGWNYSEDFLTDFQNFLSHFDVTAIEIKENNVGIPTLRGRVLGANSGSCNARHTTI